MVRGVGLRCSPAVWCVVTCCCARVTWAGQGGHVLLGGIVTCCWVVWSRVTGGVVTWAGQDGHVLLDERVTCCRVGKSHATTLTLALKDIHSHVPRSRPTWNLVLNLPIHPSPVYGPVLRLSASLPCSPDGIPGFPRTRLPIYQHTTHPLHTT